ncbi:MAG: putative lipid II flippase FtsW [Halobacteriovoraceae bacterium]|nr:putative lipid II flippase FtsW [Halobacteriovoraceae bacterium]
MEIKDVSSKTLNLFIVNAALLCITGLIFIYSASYMFAKEEFGNSAYFFLRQLTYVLVSIGFCFLLAKTKFSFWYKHSLKINFLCTLLIVLTLIPSIGFSSKGSARWLHLGFMNLQPGEFAKYSVLLSSVYFFHHFKFWTNRQKIIYFFILTGPLFFLIIQPDFGMFVICLVNLLFVCFLSSFPRKWFYSIVSAGLLLVVSTALIAPYRVRRLLVFMNPWEDPQNSGFQIIQSFLAFAQGGLIGSGIGNSKEKLFYLPEAHNDFIFSVMGEEMGLIGLFLIILLFGSFLYLGFRLALTVENKTKSLFAVAAIFTIVLQAILNMGVVLGLLPTKGLNLPFISYGGSSLLANAILLGLFFSILTKKNQESNYETAE